MRLIKYLFISAAAVVTASAFMNSGIYAASNTSPEPNSSSARKVTSSKNSNDEASSDSLTLAVNDAVLGSIPEGMNKVNLRVNKVTPNSSKKSVNVSLNDHFSSLPITREFVNNLNRTVKRSLPDSIRQFNINLNVGDRPLTYYIKKIDKLPAKYQQNTPFVTAVNPYVHPKKGMEGDIIALWHSHGRYYRSGGWNWQRSFLFQSLEDTYTMGYVLPFLVPMLENAGAYVMLPRERDFNRNEVIVDNDTNEGGLLFSQTTYREENGSQKWQNGEGEGFIYDLPDFRDTENPFENGTYREVRTVKGNSKISSAAWYADIPEDGEYAVYVSYKTLPNSTTDAHYTVNYSGGSKEFRVNQKMGGGTWIYLGTFPLNEGYSNSTPVVTLTNVTEKGGEQTVVTADAVKIGGGIGNIARSPSRSDIYYDPSTPDPDEIAQNSSKESDEDEDDLDPDGNPINTSDDIIREDPNGKSKNINKNNSKKKSGRAPTFSTSGLPRYLEGARYWMHWAGFPEKVYSPFNGKDDYKDDYTSRGHWVNYLAGGSRVLPNREGLNIPVDISFALHSDAGKRSDDSTVGTLGIYYTNGGASYADGTPRSSSRVMTDMLMTQIAKDIRSTYEPKWSRRDMWDKSYLEARVAEVPTTLLEILSHQNFGDMMYGNDPRFRFLVSRSIYKAMARFISDRKDREVVIQPLPVKNFAIKQVKKGEFHLSWEPTPDRLEPTAMPNKYVILERTEGSLGFHKVGESHSAHFNVKVSDDLIHSYKIIATNEGGSSFPSETLSLRMGKKPDAVLIVNGFDRVSAPGIFSENGRAGFDSKNDFGVPYIKDASFAGYQTEFRRGSGDFGKSDSSGVGIVVAGNTFDFPAVHGDAIADLQYGFVSCSSGAVENGTVNLANYKYVDLILGKQKRTTMGHCYSGVEFEAFPEALRNKLTSYVKNGGHLLVSGSFAISDLYDSRADESSHDFAENVLGVTIDEDASRTNSGKIEFGSGNSQKKMAYSNTVNEDQYIVEKPDALQPSGNGRIVAKFTDSHAGAGVASSYGKGTVTVYSIPLESLKEDADRRTVLGNFLNK